MEKVSITTGQLHLLTKYIFQRIMTCAYITFFKSRKTNQILFRIAKYTEFFYTNKDNLLK